MAEDQSAEKTEEPTPKQREKFREEGNIATSPDVGGAAILAIVLLVVALGGGPIYRGIAGSFTDSFELAGRVRDFGTLDLYTQVARSSGAAYLRAIGLVVAACGAAGLAAGVAQTGLNFSLKPMELKAEKFNPVTTLKNKIFSIWAVAQVGLSLLKALVIAVALFFVIRAAMPMMLTLPGLELEASLALLGGVFLKLFIVGVLAASALAIADYALNRMRIHKQMKMSKQEVKEEHKQQEGDPLVKGRLRQRMRQIGRNKMLAETADADVVVVNPTHYAVALAYNPDEDNAPRVLSKGKDQTALRIREIARKHQIPIIANPPVARALHEFARIGEPVPNELYAMVARVLAYLYRMTQRRAAA